jgi:hypothetical protein
MRRRHIRVMAKMRLSDLIRSEDARTGRKNVATVAGMVGASALGSLILWVANAYADSFSFGVCCPPGQTPNVVCQKDGVISQALLQCLPTYGDYTMVSCPSNYTIICGPQFYQSCYAFTCHN